MGVLESLRTIFKLLAFKVKSLALALTLKVKSLGLEGQVLGLGLELEGQFLGLGLEGQVLGLIPKFLLPSLVSRHLNLARKRSALD